MNRFYMAGVVVCASALGLLGCGDKPDSTVQITVGSTAPTAAPAPAPADTLAPRYEATLAEGIDFRKPGYPKFLTAVSGMSMYEAWGRWSDGSLLSFKFKQPLPDKFTLVIHGGAFGPNIGKAFKVKIGVEEKELIFKSRAFDTPTTNRLDFKLNTPADTIDITVPAPAQPGNGDTRNLGLGMISLKIEN